MSYRERTYEEGKHEGYMECTADTWWWILLISALSFSVGFVMGLLL